MFKKGFAHPLLLSIIAIALVGTAGYLLSQKSLSGRVLGEDESRQEEQKNEQEKQQESDQKNRENEAEQLKKEFERRKESETKTSDGTVIKTKIEDDGSRKLEIESTNGAKFKFEEHKSSESAENENELENEFENEDDDATESAVVRHMIDEKVIDRVSTEPGSIKLELRNGRTIYKVEGFKYKKIFGLLPIELKTTTLVSTESAQVVSQIQSLWDQILNLISF